MLSLTNFSTVESIVWLEWQSSRMILAIFGMISFKYMSFIASYDECEWRI